MHLCLAPSSRIMSSISILSLFVFLYPIFLLDILCLYISFSFSTPSPFSIISLPYTYSLFISFSPFPDLSLHNFPFLFILFQHILSLHISLTVFHAIYAASLYLFIFSRLLICPIIFKGIVCASLIAFSLVAFVLNFIGLMQ